MPTEYKKIDLIVTLGGGLKKDRNGTWRTRNYNESSRGSAGERLRVLASYYLYNNLDKGNLFVIASGGKGMSEKTPGSPTAASVIKKELINLGVPPKKVIEESRANTTYQQLLWLTKLTTNKKYGDIRIISNKYHLPRIQAMMEYCTKINLVNKIKLVSAEQVLLKHAPNKWREVIQSAYLSSKMNERINSEMKGVNDIKRKIYKFK